MAFNDSNKRSSILVQCVFLYSHMKYYMKSDLIKNDNYLDSHNLMGCAAPSPPPPQPTPPPNPGGQNGPFIGNRSRNYTIVNLARGYKGPFQVVYGTESFIYRFYQPFVNIRTEESVVCLPDVWGFNASVCLPVCSSVYLSTCPVCLLNV